MNRGLSKITERLRKRFGHVTVLFIILLAIIAGRLFLIKVMNGEDYTQAANDLKKIPETIEAKRGDILDRNNVLLATSTTQYTLILDPGQMLEAGEGYADLAALVIEKCLGYPQAQIRDMIMDNPDRRYLVLESGMSYNRIKDLLDLLNGSNDDMIRYLGLPEDYEGLLRLKGVTLEDSFKRNYIYNTFASSVIGFEKDGTGQYGIEKYYDSVLSGTDGKQYEYVNDEYVVENVYREEENGNTVQLTLDYNIQSIVEKYVMEMLEESGASTVAVTIQDPNTGEFLAMADSGIFDPNDPWDLTVRYSDYEIEQIKSSDAIQTKTLTENWRNFCVADSYEPGSTFKAFTVAAGLEEGSVSEYEYFNCDGSVPMLDYTIHCADIDGHGDISLKDALAQSCNIAMMDIAAAEGVDIFSKYQSQFGFGCLTDIDLPNEMSCRNLIYTRENMTDLDLAVNSFGQSFNVTMVQMSSAFCSLINGGIYYKPHVVKGIYNPDGELVASMGRTVVSRPVSEETSDFIKSALRRVVTEGTGTDAAVPGYLTAGKTGTAQKGKRNLDMWVASFIGFAPYEDPQLVCYVVIDEPASGGDGSSEYACELFRNIMSEVLPYINAVPAYMENDPEGAGSPIEDEEDEYTDEDSEEDENNDDEDNDDEDNDEEDNPDDAYYDYGDYDYDDYDYYGYNEYYEDQYYDEGFINADENW